ncbi:MAG: glycoside hydrolase family 25 protein [Chitinophagaceae bacterium]
MAVKKPILKRSPARKKGGLSKKSKRTILVYLIIVFLVIMGATGLWLYREWQSYQRAIKAKFPEFGIQMPAQFLIHGIDVSRYQKKVAWQEVVNMEVLGVRIGFCFIKATEGRDHIDNRFHHNWRAVQKVGLPRGAYHFFIASQPGLAQARHFLEEVNFLPGDLPPVLDIEQLNRTSVSVMRREALRWLEEVEKVTGVKPIIYTNIDFYNKYLGEDFDDYPLWIAHYYRTDAPALNRNWLFWQHSDIGNVNGIDAKVDFNVFNGDSTAFRSLLIQ